MKKERNQLIKELRIAGMTYAEISEKFGISIQRVEQIINQKPKCKVIKDYPNDLAPIRISRNMTASEVAAMFGKSNAWMTKVEHGGGRISRETYNKFLEIYNVDKIDGVKIKDNKEIDARIELLEKENTMLMELLSFYVNSEDIKGIVDRLVERG